MDEKIRKLTNRVESLEKLTNRVQNLENMVKKKVRKMNIFLVKHSKIFYITNSSMLEHNYQKLIREEKTTSLAAGGEHGFSVDGRCAVLQNIMQCIIDDSELLKLEVSKDHPDAFIYNAFIFRTITGIQNILDSVTRLCNDLYPSASRGDANIYFNSYSFERGEVRKILYFRSKIQGLKFNKKSFNDIANKLKHELPFVGRVTTSDIFSKIDIFDSDDQGFVYDFAMPILTYTKNIIAFVSSFA